MSVPALSSEVQLRYMLQWFSEFSELQREDFLPVLAAAKGDQQEQLASALAGLTCQDKPVSLFQCRLKLFNDWFPTWSEDERSRLLKGITEMDSDFAKKLHQQDMTTANKVNGDTNGFDITPDEEQHPAIPENEIFEPIQEIRESVVGNVEPVDETVEPIPDSQLMIHETKEDETKHMNLDEVVDDEKRVEQELNEDEVNKEIHEDDQKKNEDIEIRLDVDKDCVKINENEEDGEENGVDDGKINIDDVKEEKVFVPADTATENIAV